MKRLLVRMSALAVVLALGWFAIAHAQRGQEDTTVASGAEESSQAKADPLFGPAARQLNPLRSVSAGEEAKPTVVVSSGTTRQAGLNRVNSASESSSRADQYSNPFAVRPVSHVVAAEAGAAPQETPAQPNSEGATAASSRRRSSPVYPWQPEAEPPLETRRLEPPPVIQTPPLTTHGNPSGEANASLDRYGRPTQPRAAETTDRYGRTTESAQDTTAPAPFRADAGTEPVSLGQRGSAEERPLGMTRVPSEGNFSERTYPDATAVGGGEGTGTPGGKHLEGSQSPQVTIEKFAPAEIQVGKLAKFRVTVKNTGVIAAQGVEIRDQVPRGTELRSTNPQATRGASGELVWALGTMKPGDEISVESEVMPTAEGEIGSVATVCFKADASARTIATKPQLVLETAAPRQVLIGETLTLSITVSNPGSGAASGVVLEERIPPGLKHEVGDQLEYEVGELKPGESRKLDLTLAATEAGKVTNLLVARGDAGLRVEDRKPLEVIAPKLDIAMVGPKRRFLEREATYTLSVSNPGSAPAKNVELVAYLPEGMKFVSANNAGHYEPNSRAIHWSLEELPSNDSGSVKLTAIPITTGQQKVRFSGKAERVAPVEKEQPVLVEGIAAMLFQVVDVNDPIELNGETTYEIRVVNQGTEAATNVGVAVLLPSGMRLVAAEGPTRSSNDGTRVLFDGLARLAPKADTTYRVRVQGLQPGDQRVRVQLQTDQMRTPVTKEESTRVYSDE